MSREWKPGDVAMVTQKSGGIERRSFRRGESWLCDIGQILDPYAETIRPLVVIDPEDREQVERLVTLLPHWESFDCESLADQLQTAFREFANPTPPKPDEPTGLGAVVEDDKGLCYVRVQKATEWTEAWRFVGAQTHYSYADIAAIRVLSEGVTP